MYILFRFNCLTDDTDKISGEIMTFKLYYFLEDDTIAIRELKENREGRDYFPMYLKRTKLRKNEETVSSNSIDCKRISDIVTHFFFYYKSFKLPCKGRIQWNRSIWILQSHRPTGRQYNIYCWSPFPANRLRFSNTTILCRRAEELTARQSFYERNAYTASAYGNQMDLRKTLAIITFRIIFNISGHSRISWIWHTRR